MSHELLVDLAAGAALTGLMLYAVLGGADFGGGIWDAFASGPRKAEQRAAIAHAMGPVWEANHVWLIFVIVVLFTCFPGGYGPLMIAMFGPLHLALAGIMLRGASFVFRAYGGRAPGTSGDPGPSRWGAVFGAASVISPLLLGLAFGVLTQGGVRVDESGTVRPPSLVDWLDPYTIGCGLLALSTCAYLASVFLTVETEGPLRDDFRRRAILAGTTTAALAIFVTIAAYLRAPWFFGRLTSPQSWPNLAAGLACFAGSAWAVFGRCYKLSRIFAAGEVVLLLLGWGLAQRPYLIYPDVTLFEASAPSPTIAFLLTSLPFGAALLVPSLWLLFRVFKSGPAA